MDHGNIIELSNINFMYSSESDFQIRDINLLIYEGEIFGLLGPSGAGKSTIQKFLTKLIEDYRGTITIFDRNIREYNRNFYERIGVSFELPNHYLKLSAKENLEYFQSLYSSNTLDIENLLGRVGLLQFKDEPVENFSKGMKNRLTLARALITDPEILFLDEPTAGLDPKNKEMVMQIMRAEKARGKTIFLTTHDMLVVEQVCDRVGFIIDGKIQTIGIPEELKRRFGSKNVLIQYSNGSELKQTLFDLPTLGSNQEFMDLLNTYEVHAIHSQEASLDQVFIEITGSELG